MVVERARRDKVPLRTNVSGLHALCIPFNGWPQSVFERHLWRPAEPGESGCWVRDMHLLEGRSDISPNCGLNDDKGGAAAARTSEKEAAAVDHEHIARHPGGIVAEEELDRGRHVARLADAAKKETGSAR